MTLGDRMTLERLRATVEDHGGDVATWPTETRAAAARLAEADAAAAAVLADAAAIEARLDAALGPALSDVPTPSDALRARVLADAARTAARTAAEVGAAETSSTRGGSAPTTIGAMIESLVDVLGGWAPARIAAGAVGAAAAIGLAVGVAAPDPFGPAPETFSDPLVEVAFAIDDPLEYDRPARRF